MAHQNHYGIDMFVGIVIHEDDTPGQHALFIVDHRVGGCQDFKSIQAMAKYVGREFGPIYKQHITYEPPITPYAKFTTDQIEFFENEVLRNLPAKQI